MHQFEVEGIPIPWKAHGGFGRRSFNPRYKEKEFVQWKLKSLFSGEIISGPVKIEYWFHFPIPRATSRVRTQQMLDRIIHHIKRPDCTNLVKFYEDCLKGVVIVDDSQVVESISRKSYSLHPFTVINVLPVMGEVYESRQHSVRRHNPVSPQLGENIGGDVSPRSPYVPVGRD